MTSDDNNNKLPLGTIDSLQSHLDYKIKEWGFDDETLHERLLLLVEEVGELANACRKISGMNIDINRNITSEAGEEIVDIIILAFAVGIKLGIDIEKEFFLKEAAINKRNYKRNLQKNLL